MPDPGPGVMISLAARSPLVRSCAVAPREDPLACLLASAHRELPPYSPGPDIGLVVATDGSRIGSRLVFDRAARPSTKLPPRLIPYRLSNGPASRLAIDFGYRGRVLTFSDGGSSLFRALRFVTESIEAGLGPPTWVLVAGEVETAEDGRAEGRAIALVLTPRQPAGRVLVRILPGPGPEAVVAGPSELDEAVRAAERGERPRLGDPAPSPGSPILELSA